MKNLFVNLIALILFIFIGATVPVQDDPEPSKKDEIWVTAYLASWHHNAGTQYSNWGDLTVNDIDWDAFTHLIYFAMNIGPDGRPGISMDPKERRNFNTDRLRDIVPAAHQHNKKILFSVGGAGNYEGFSSAIRQANRNRFIATIIHTITRYGFDGVDLDMEPIREQDMGHFHQFVAQLHSELARTKTRMGGKPMITIAANKGPEVSKLYASVQKYVDQINIMSYDMAQPWPGWQAWHNSALFSKGMNFESNGKEMSSIQQKVEIALDAGIERKKLGIGIDFYGYIWHTVHLLEKWRTWPRQDYSIIERSGGVPYSELYQRYDLDKADWDPHAETSYLNIDMPKTFVSFDNERSIQRKIQYALDEGLGGIMLWELGGGFVKSRSIGARDPLLQAVKEKMNPNFQTVK